MDWNVIEALNKLAFTVDKQKEIERQQRKQQMKHGSR